jgi:hypothetical protein
MDRRERPGDVETLDGARTVQVLGCDRIKQQ